MWSTHLTLISWQYGSQLGHNFSHLVLHRPITWRVRGVRQFVIGVFDYEFGFAFWNRSVFWPGRIFAQPLFAALGQFPLCWWTLFACTERLYVKFQRWRRSWSVICWWNTCPNSLGLNYHAKNIFSPTSSVLQRIICISCWIYSWYSITCEWLTLVDSTTPGLWFPDTP